MKLIDSKTHGIIDYMVGGLLMFAPAVLDLPYLTSCITYVIAGGYLILTLLTRFEVGVLKVIPFRIHGWIELFTIISTVAVAIYLNNREGNIALVFFLALAALNFLVWLMTDFNSATSLNQRKI